MQEVWGFVQQGLSGVWGRDYRDIGQVDEGCVRYSGIYKGIKWLVEFQGLLQYVIVIEGEWIVQYSDVRMQSFCGQVGVQGCRRGRGIKIVQIFKVEEGEGRGREEVSSGLGLRSLIIGFVFFVVYLIVFLERITLRVIRSFESILRGGECWFGFRYGGLVLDS